VDHGLRAGAAAELEQAQRFATALGVPFGTSSLQVAPGGNLQARARVARHQALQAAGREAGATAIALGHTADDRAETVLMRLLRGAGPRGLAAMPARVEGQATGPHELAEPAGDGDAPLSRAGGDAPLPRVRPLLRARRADVQLHLERHQVPSSADPSNEDPRFLRVRVRRELLPLLAELSPSIVAHLCALADTLGAAEPPADARAAAIAFAAGVPALGRAQREAIERARRDGGAPARVRLRGGAEVTVSFPDAGIVVNPDGGRSSARKRVQPKPVAATLATAPATRATTPVATTRAVDETEREPAAERPRDMSDRKKVAPKPARARKVPRSTAGGKGGMLVDSEKKGRVGATPGASQVRPSLGPPRPPSRGSS